MVQWVCIRCHQPIVDRSTVIPTPEGVLHPHCCQMNLLSRNVEKEATMTKIERVELALRRAEPRFRLSNLAWATAFATLAEALVPVSAEGRVLTDDQEKVQALADAIKAIVGDE